jgi:ATP-dependent RNA helicase RhlE
MEFSDLGLSQPILRAIGAEGYVSPTPIQAMAIPHVLGGRDLFGCAQTGTGKTAAFALPILDRLAATAGPQIPGTQRDQRKVRALVLTPTRELAAQIAESFGTYGRHTSLRHAVVYGGVNINRQIQALARGVDVLVATPGRLLDLMHQRAVSLSSIQVLVLDEADRMLDMGFVHDVKRITNTLPRERQTLLFSATIPDNIRALAQSLLSSPVNVAVTPVSSAAETLEQSVYFVEKTDKRRLLVWVLRDDRIDRTLAFTRTKHGANRVAEHLVKSGIPAAAIHGDKSQNARERALDSFKRGQLRVLVATDIAARGIDIDQLSFVINYDLPNTPETYVHRIGRSGRAGASGSALSFCDAEERPYLRGIERLIRSTIPVVGDHPYASGSSAASVADLDAAAPAPRNGGGDRSRNNGGGGGSRGGQQQHRGRQPQRSNGAEQSGAVPIVTQSAPARAVKPGFSAGRGRRF